MCEEYAYGKVQAGNQVQMPDAPSSGNGIGLIGSHY